ncbi:MAG: MotA/TolQ/ExbB proton channel family protein [Planctomycetia bacterium]|nr:MotA/TolQ/ExbB proton channel family protein [Planctomycetia bacterium]
MYEIITSGGLVGLIIFFLSLASVALVVDQGRSLRKKILLPQEQVEKLRELISTGQLQAADTYCRENPGTLTFIVRMGLQECDGDWSDMEKTLEDVIGEESARLYRRVEFLSVIGNVAPMLGLLGTVLGMITAFQQIAATQGSAQGPELARGIYQALVTTVEGLIVAIPSIGAFAFFRNRIDQLMAEMTYTVQRLFLPLKRYRRKTRGGKTA